MYVNTPGTSTPDGRAIGFETEAFAISDCMNYIKPPVYTIGVGQVRKRGCGVGDPTATRRMEDGKEGRGDLVDVGVLCACDFFVDKWWFAVRARSTPCCFGHGGRAFGLRSWA